MMQQRGGQPSGILVAGLALVLGSVATAADQAPLELVQTIPLKGNKAGKLDHCTLDAKRDRLFVANSPNNSLDIVDLKAGSLLKQVRGQQGVQGLAYAPDLDRVYVGLGTGGFCNIFDGQDYQLKQTVKFEDDADNVRYHAGTHRVYVAHAEKALGVIDAKTAAKITDIKLPGAAEAFQLEKERPRLYLNTPSPSQVLVIDTDKNEVISQYPLKLTGGNYPLAIDEANHRLFIGCRKQPMLVVMDSESGKEITGLEIPGDIDDLYHDAKRKRLYASCGEGFLAVIRQIDNDHYELLAKIPTAKDARTCFFDPAGGRLFLVVPKQPDKDSPEIRVYQAR